MVNMQIKKKKKIYIYIYTNKKITGRSSGFFFFCKTAQTLSGCTLIRREKPLSSPDNSLLA